MTVNECPHQTVVNIAGLITNRQQPGTANGVTFLTLEDESGQVNAVVWASVMARHQRAISSGHLLIIQGGRPAQRSGGSCSGPFGV